MTAKEIRLHKKLSDKWATGRATEKEILRCMELDRKTAADRKAEAAQ